MSDTPNAAPAGASEQTAMPETGPMDRSTAVNLLAELDRPPEKPAEAAPEATDQPTIETPTDDASDESAEAETEGEDAAPEEDAAAEDTEADADPDAQDQFVHGNAKTRLRDGTVVSIGELKKRADEAAEYHAKVPNLAAAAQRIQEREAQLAQQEQQSRDALTNAYNIVNALIPPEPSPELMLTDPVGHYEQEKRREYTMRQLQQILGSAQAQQQHLMQQDEKAREAERQAMLARNHQVLSEKIPEISDPVKHRKFMDDITAAVAPFGFTAEEVSQTVEPRLLHMVHVWSKEVAAYRQLMEQKETAQAKTKAAPPVQKPGPRVSAEQAQKRVADDQLRQWRDSGASRAGAAAILGNLD